jgi:phosphate transport system ATP-binding protein
MVESVEVIRIEDLSLQYTDGCESLRNVSLGVISNAINVFFGPAGGGKSSLLRVLNRLNDLAEVKKLTGKVIFEDTDILDKKLNIIELRRKIGIVFSRPMPLPLTIYQNVSYGLEVAGEQDRKKLDAAVEEALRAAYLWDEVNDRLHDPAAAISGGQQQRLCIARVLALKPKVILLDEPTSALDPVSTAKIEQGLQELKQTYTIVLVPHNVQQAARMADYAAFFLQGELIEFGKGTSLFLSPKDKRTQDYVEGRFG